MPWYYAVAERDHEIQNPTSAEKILLLGERLRLSPDSHVLDVACGKCGPAILLARKFGCAITGIERASEFAAEARERIAASGLADRIEVIEADASRAEIEPAGYDAAMCLGASFVWADLAGTLPHLRRATRRDRRRRLRLAARHRRSVPRSGADRRDADRLVARRLGPLRDVALAGARGLARCASRGSRGRRAPAPTRGQPRRVPPLAAGPARLGDFRGA